jgi:hypothetical protein
VFPLIEAQVAIALDLVKALYAFWRSALWESNPWNRSFPCPTASELEQETTNRVSQLETRGRSPWSCTDRSNSLPDPQASPEFPGSSHRESRKQPLWLMPGGHLKSFADAYGMPRPAGAPSAHVNQALNSP